MEVVKSIKRNVLLNPGPATTSDAVKYAQVVPDICPREQEFVDIMTDVRKDLVKVVHGDPEKYSAIIFTGSGTIIQDVLVNSLVPEGKKICVVNNGAYSARMVEIAKYYHIPCVDLKFDSTELPDLTVVKEALEKDKDIAVVATVHHETGTGVLNPIKEIGRMAHDNDAIFVVDTISTYGLLPIDIEEQNIDFLMSSAQKGLAAMTGVSWTVGNIEEIKKTKAYPTRSYYCNLFMQYDFFDRVGEMHFTPPVQTMYALQQAIKEYFEEGEQDRWERLTKCWEAIHKGLEEMGLGTVIDKEIQGHLVVTVRAPEDGKFDFFKLHDYCFERGFTIYPGKMFGLQTFRLCNLGLITEKDIQDFFVVAKEAFQEMGYTFPIATLG
ncbi:MAG: 2-aminoethylphosphonate--pyruvate aminotransferase [Deltaproteobacteria bacterium]|nr:MAG: 2-aminoethylphosphonate--pyruvate aminotransferase [Deltaproteobacteria bacterium]RLC18014.1 MAG: 2-aminoethylphosphonate--pyruvate aminotransferase [Deltaproteobacteria bacterium]